jgi:uncharacterized protein (TIGR00725 family)
MPRISIRRKPVIIGIMGSHKNDSSAVNEAYALGEAIAERGYVLLTGGGGGVMEAASEGAYRSGGLVIAILPSEKKRPLKGYPNEFVDIPIYTGMYDARNIINAKTPDIIVALNGSAGTLSEIAIALKSGTPVIGLHCPSIDLEDDEYEFLSVTSVDEAIRKIDELVKKLKKE